MVFISGLFFGFAFGVAGIASAVLGNMADHYGIEAVYNVCGFMPLFRTGYLVPSQLEKEVKTILPFSLLLLQLNVNY